LAAGSICTATVTLFLSVRRTDEADEAIETCIAVRVRAEASKLLGTVRYMVLSGARRVGM
jgi:hypothetical protein